MSAEQRNGSGGSSGKTRCFTSSEGLVTYKRRKLGTPGSGSAPKGDPSVSSAGQQAMEVGHDTVICNGVYEPDTLARIEIHWRSVLDDILKLPDVSGGKGIESCIQKALISGPFGFTSKLNMDSAQSKEYVNHLQDTRELHGVLQGEAQKENSFMNAAKKHMGVISNGFHKVTCDQTDVHVITKKCQKELLEVLASEKFALFCDLLSKSFPGIKANCIVDFSLINSKMKSGVYAESFGLFHQDMQQVWEKIQKIGQEMALLANNLSNISQLSYQRQVGEHSEAGDQRINKAGADKSFMGSYTTTQFPCESDHSTKPEQTEAPCLYKISTCKHCGAVADGMCSLICDGCEAMYHFSCIKPAVQEIPTRSWYCASCTTNTRESVEPGLTNTQQESLHQNCVVCDRLKIPGTQVHLTKSPGENAMPDDSRESSVSSMESDEVLEPSMTCLSRLCKVCGTCEDVDKRFLQCEYPDCHYKYYHIRCLKSSQIASDKQPRQSCWYCPSCLCRGCFINKDDDKIIMCDGCDEAYHIYCTTPPCTSVPKGKWYCVSCNISRAKEGMKRYEQWVLQKHKKNDVKFLNGAQQSVDILLSAAEKLSSEDRSAAARKSR